VQDAIVWRAPSLDLAGGFFEIPKSPAPPVVALLGLLGMVLGEQFGIWVQTKKLDVSRAASVCLVGERYDRPPYNPPSRKTHYAGNSIFAEHIPMTDEVDTRDVHRE
jgi:hypothetical protein